MVRAETPFRPRHPHTRLDVSRPSESRTVTELTLQPVTEPVKVTAARPREVMATDQIYFPVNEPVEVTDVGIIDTTSDRPPKPNSMEQASAHMKVN